MDKNKELDKFVEAIDVIFSGMNPKTFWPLNGGQINAYSEIDEALDVYDRLNSLKGRLNLDEVSDLMPPADIVRLFIEHNAIVGLKAAKKFGVRDISKEDMTDYTLFLFEILKKKSKGDIFCLDGRNLLLDSEEIDEIIQDIRERKEISDEDKKKIAFLTVMGNNLCYTLFYDIYMAGGFYIHGPYDVSGKFGEGATLVVRDYHNICPKELWPELEMPYKSMKICAVYRGLDMKIDFANHPTSTSPVGDRLVAYKIFLDGKEIDVEDIERLVETFQKVSSGQIKKINSMSDLDRVRKGVEIAYYLFRDFRVKTGGDWRPSENIAKVVEKFGDKFVKQFKYVEKAPSIDHWKKLFDPRVDYI